MFKRVQCALTVVCIYSSTVLGGAETTTATRASLSIGIGRTDRFGRDVNPDYQQHIHDVLTATRLNRISSISHDLENATPNLEAEHRINTSAIKGANYIPSYAPNSISTWIDYDERVIARELSYAKSGNINSVRVTLHHLAWQNNSEWFLASVNSFVNIAHNNDLNVVFVLFDNKGGDPPPNVAASGAYKTLGWLAGPGTTIVQEGPGETWSLLEAYVAAVVGALNTSATVIGYDIMNIPVTDGGQLKAYAAFATHFYGIVNATDSPVHWKTFSILPGGAACGSPYFPLMDVVAFQNFNGNPGAISGDTAAVENCAAPKPVVLTEFVHRTGNPASPLCEGLFEVWGQVKTQWSNIHAPAGYFVNQLILGTNQYCANNDTGLIYPDGNWFMPSEQICISATTPPLPPPPGGPPPPYKSFQIGGLNVALRQNLHTVQNLSIVDDLLWGKNFSTNTPKRPTAATLARMHLVRPGPFDAMCAATTSLGDITLRVQPGAETNTSSWATYSSSQADVHVQQCGTTTLSTTTPMDAIVDACDITQMLNAPGQLDTRYPLGLDVTREWSTHEDNGGTLVLKFIIRNSNTTAVRLGAFGMTLPADCSWGGHDTEQVAATLSFIDGSISGRGHATWTRADGSSTLVVMAGNNNTAMEAWRPVLEDEPLIQGGTYEWTVHSHAWASEWATNRQTPFMDMAYTDSYGEIAWPLASRSGKSPWPKWHAHEVFAQPNPQAWNPPTAKVLQPGEQVEYALKFSLTKTPQGANSDSSSTLHRMLADPSDGPEQLHGPDRLSGPEQREAVLRAAGEPFVHAVPGFAIATDMTTAALFVFVPPNTTILKVSTVPSDALTFSNQTAVGGFQRLSVTAVKAFVRVRVELSFGAVGGSEPTSWFSLNYHTLPSFTEQIANYGNWAASTAWLPETFPDPFNRGASVVPWDREERRHVLQDGRPFIVGLSDDAGGGNHLGFAAKVTFATVAEEVARIDDYIRLTLYGKKNGSFLAQPSFSLQEPDNDRILMTVFYFHYSKGYKDPVQFSFPGNPNYYTETDKCFTGPSWCAFNALTPDEDPSTWHPNDYRVYNFPHQINSYYAMYRVARNFDHIPTVQPWQWYLNRAYKTLLAFGCFDNETETFQCIPNVGVMDGTVFREVLVALEDEGADDVTWKGKANRIAEMMYNRTVSGFNGNPGWNDQAAPFGSEFNWDTTGQEEVAIWGAYFNASSEAYGDLNERVVRAILAYVPNVPNFAWHGSAAGWGDFSNNAKWMVTGGWEREGQHYRAGLNSIPVIERYRRYPDAHYLLETAMGAITGSLCNIDASGAPSMGFHTHPFIMDYDPYSGDSGLGFYGITQNAASYILRHPVFGWICYTCDVASHTTTSVTIFPRDGFHRKVYVEPVGLYIESLTATIDYVKVDLTARRCILTFTNTAQPALFVNYVLRLTDEAGSRRPGSAFVVQNATVARRLFITPRTAGLAVTITWQT